MRGRVLRAMLAREQEAVNKGEGDKGDLTAANYDLSRPDATARRVVHIKPKRNDVMLVDGAVLDDGGDSSASRGACRRIRRSGRAWSHRPPLRAHRGVRAGGDRDDRQGEIRRHGAARSALRLPERQRRPVAVSGCTRQRFAYRRAIRFVRWRDERGHINRERCLEQPLLLRRIAIVAASDVRRPTLIRQPIALSKSARARACDPPSSGGRPSKGMSAS